MRSGRKPGETRRVCPPFNPGQPPVNIPIQPLKWVLNWVVNSPTPKWDPIGFDPQPFRGDPFGVSFMKTKTRGKQPILEPLQGSALMLNQSFWIVWPPAPARVSDMPQLTRTQGPKMKTAGITKRRELAPDVQNRVRGNLQDRWFQN